jgi:ech hydrogenase subunit A
MNILIFLIGLPLLTAFVLLAVRQSTARAIVVTLSALALIIGSMSLFSIPLHGGIQFFGAHNELVEILMLLTEIGIAGYLIYLGIKNRRWIVPVLVVVQTGALLGFELFFKHGLEVHYNLFIDNFSLIMALIVGIVGGLITIFALGYMPEYHHHQKELRDKQPFFYFVVFAFLSAMFGIIFSNNLLWALFFWEITTVASFLLIGYKGDAESTNNAFYALTMNLIGGLFFVAGILFTFSVAHTIELDQMLLGGQPLILGAVLLGLAGCVKSAQMPFSKWLLGAMVAPTPVSALLHSSTMVKAGVYLVVKMSPLLKGTFAGTAISLIGGITFLLTSLLAIAQSDAKKVLAYSTIANLGLIVVCAGIGTYEAVWAAILLIIFHAVAKCLLFLCVGTAEHKLHSRNIESMDGLIQVMPRVAWMLLVGMAGMFLAPFGMLISKWAALKALVDAHTAVIVLVIFGSSASLFFWVKWMGKLIFVGKTAESDETGIPRAQWITLYALAGLTIAVCAGFPLVSSILIEPYVIGVYGVATRMARGNILIMLMMLGMIMMFPFTLPRKGEDKNAKIVGPYLAGENTGELTSHRGTLDIVYPVSTQNYYLDDYFGEKVLLTPSLILGSLLVVGTLVIGVLA